jgi:hypothetical protein
MRSNTITSSKRSTQPSHACRTYPKHRSTASEKIAPSCILHPTTHGILPHPAARQKTSLLQSSPAHRHHLHRYRIDCSLSHLPTESHWQRPTKPDCNSRSLAITTIRAIKKDRLQRACLFYLNQHLKLFFREGLLKRQTTERPSKSLPDSPELQWAGHPECPE